MPKKIPLKEEPDKLLKYKNDKYYFSIEKRYVVYVNKNYVDVWTIPKNTVIQPEEFNSLNKNHFTKKVASFNKPLKIFMGSFLFEHDTDAILVQIEKNKYAIIYQNVATFTTRKQITEFNSVVFGHYAYPFCYDEEGNCYVIDQEIILEKYKEYLQILKENPYEINDKNYTPIQKKLKVKFIDTY